MSELFELKNAPGATVEAYLTSPTVESLGWAKIAPLLTEAEIDDVGTITVAAWTFRWDEQAPTICCLATAGLWRYEQSLPRIWCFPRTELAFAFTGPPESLASAAYSFLTAAVEFRTAIVKDGASFGMGDGIEDLPLVDGMPSALLVPPVPELVISGLRPYKRFEDGFEPSTLTAKAALDRWSHPDVLRARGDIGFVQVVPLHDAEYRWMSEKHMGYELFAKGLLATPDEEEKGAQMADFLLDLDRGVRLPDRL
jgi:hypothetical protein